MWHGIASLWILIVAVGRVLHRKAMSLRDASCPTRRYEMLHDAKTFDIKRIADMSSQTAGIEYYKNPKIITLYSNLN